MPNVIVSSGYIRSTEHYLNYLTYSGEKLEAQTLILKDGTSVDVDPDEKIDPYAIESLDSIKIEFKDGTSRYLTPARYQKFTEEKEDGYVEHTLVLEDGTEKALTPEVYLKYMGERPSVEKDEDFGHGLFDMDGIVDMQKERQRVIDNDGNIKWSHIVSLSREDAARTGFDNRQAWQNLIRAKAYDLARIYNISPENLILNAAFHDKAHHPHMHLFFYSTDNREGTFAGKDALVNKTEKMKSLFNNTIFSGDAAYLKEEKQEYKKAFQNEMEQITKAIGRKGYEPDPKIEKAFSDLSDALIDYTGRPYYQYLQPEVKLQVQDVLKKCVELDPNLNKLFSRTCDNQKAFLSMYADAEEKINKRLDSFKEHFYNPDGKNDSRTLHNIIIKNAMLYNQKRAPGARVVRKKESSSFSNELILPDNHEQPYTLETGVVRKEKTPQNENEPAVSNNQFELYRLGKQHLNGVTVPKNMEKALSCFTASADQGNPFAQYTLGKLYLAGKDVPKNINKAILYLEDSARPSPPIGKDSGNNGNEFAQYTLGKLYLAGKDVPKDMNKALAYLTASAAERVSKDGKETLPGNQFSQYTLGKLYLDGIEIPKDVNKAVSYLEDSARPRPPTEKDPGDSGNEFAQYTLGKLYLAGEDMPKDMNKALAYLTASAAERVSKDGNETLPGNQFSQYTLGKLYLEGIEVGKDAKKAISYLEDSARPRPPTEKDPGDSGNEFAQYTLGKLYLAGEDVPKDMNKALAYLTASAAERVSKDGNETLPGNQFAQYQLGKLYLEGTDIQKDMPMALEYLNKSAGQGNQFAQYALGMAYYKGVDIPKNKLLAKEYFGMAASQGNDSAKTMLKVMKSQELRPAYAACHMLFQLGNTMARQTQQNLSPDINNQKDKDKNKNPPRFKTRRHTKKKTQSIPRENPIEY